MESWTFWRFGCHSPLKSTETARATPTTLTRYTMRKESDNWKKIHKGFRSCKKYEGKEPKQYIFNSLHMTPNKWHPETSMREWGSNTLKVQAIYIMCWLPSCISRMTLINYQLWENWKNSFWIVFCVPWFKRDIPFE